MDNITGKFSYWAHTAKEDVKKTVEVSLEDYKRASDANMTFKQYINAKCSDASSKFGCAFDQAVQGMGLGNKLHGNVLGSMTPTLSQVYHGMSASPASNFDLSTIVAPDGTDTSPAGRIFYPEIVMDVMRHALLNDNSDIENGFSSMIAVTDNISGSVYIQPKIDVTGNEDIAAQTIAQGSDPAVMINISSSQVTRTIPTHSVGMQVTDQALNYVTLDLVGTIIGAQTKGQRARMVDANISNIINGDVDLGMTALSAVTLQSYDSAITAAGTATHKAFLKMLHEDYQKASYDSAIMSIDTYLAFEGRAGRPTVDKDRGTDSRLNTGIRPINFSLSDLNILLVADSVVGANQALFMDSRYALRRVVDVSATYSAVQAVVMRRLNLMRADFGESTNRLYDDASKLVSLTVA